MIFAKSMLYTSVWNINTRHWEGTDSFLTCSNRASHSEYPELEVIGNEKPFQKTWVSFLFLLLLWFTLRGIFWITYGSTVQSWHIIVPIPVLTPESLVCLKAPQWVECVCVWYILYNLYLESSGYSKWKSWTKSTPSLPSLAPGVWSFLIRTLLSWRRLVRWDRGAASVIPTILIICLLGSLSHPAVILWLFPASLTETAITVTLLSTWPLCSFFNSEGKTMVLNKRNIPTRIPSLSCEINTKENDLISSR